MPFPSVNIRKYSLRNAALLAFLGLALAGCVVYPGGYGYGYGYGGGYAPAYYAPPVYGGLYIGGGGRWR